MRKHRLAERLLVDILGLPPDLVREGASFAELIRVLAYPKFKLTAAEQQELLADYLPYCTTIVLPDPPPVTPACRDPFDLPFLQLALAGKADALVTGDGDLLALADVFAPPILSAEQFLGRLPG